jgi:hypothetical protein
VKETMLVVSDVTISLCLTVIDVLALYDNYSFSFAAGISLFVTDFPEAFWLNGSHGAPILELLSVPIKWFLLMTCSNHY